MKKVTVLFFQVVLIMLLLNGCGGKEKETNENYTKEYQEWKISYARCLKDSYENKDANEMVEFLIKDLDSNGIPELVIKQEEKLTIYTFNTVLEKIGSFDFMTGTTRVFYSDNESYPGIFYFYVSGGLNHYGYISIEDNKFKSEELWNEDYSGISKEIGVDRDRIQEFSEDKQLIEESRKVYDKNFDLIFIELNSSNLNDLELKLGEYA